MDTQTLSDILGIHAPSPVHKLQGPPFDEAEIDVWVKRDDLLHPIISGNKWRKLKFALLEAVTNGVTEIVSFGGGHSNHLHALGWCCRQLNIGLTALVRGDYSANPTPMLIDLQSWGANIQFLNKVTYQQKTSDGFLSELRGQYPQAIIVPEGGSQQQALQGVAEILAELPEQFDHILCPVGSGGTLAGILHAQPTATVTGVAVLKGQDYLEGLVNSLLPSKVGSQWQINHEFHFGGYAKSPPELVEFCRQFAQQNTFEIEPVYSGKLFFALDRMSRRGDFAPGSKVLALHTGGLQGAR